MSSSDHTDNVPLTRKQSVDQSGSWQEFANGLFERCLAWPDGPIHSDENIRKLAANLSELFESIRYIELTSFETKDIRDFFRSYEMLLEIVEAGPGKPNGFHLSLFKPKTELYETFARAAKQAIEIVDANLVKIDAESSRARTNHELGLDKQIDDSLPQNKMKITITTDLIHALDTLHRISKGLSISTGKFNESPAFANSTDRNMSIAS